MTAELDTLLIGESQPLAVTVRDAGGNVIETGEITWTVDKPSVASVVGDVLVAKSAGTVKVTANIGQSTGSATLVILPLSAATVTVAPATATLGVGQVLQLTAALSDIRGMPLTGRAISWSSSAPSVATVNASTGLATMVSAGDVTFTATSDDANGTADVSVITYPTPSFTTPVVSAGYDHLCGVTAFRVAYCWGDNSQGQRGIGTATGVGMIPVNTPLRFFTISAGQQFTLALTTDGTAYGWGYNRTGALGDGTTTGRSTPVPVAGGLKFRAISAGGASTCAIDLAFKAYCWGGNLYGEVGDGTMEARTAPVPVAGDRLYSAISTGFGHTLAITLDGDLYAWGSNQFGELGLGTTTGLATDVRTVPTLVSGGWKFLSVSAGDGFSVAASGDGQALAWGLSSSAGASTYDANPRQVGITSVKAVSAGSRSADGGWFALAHLTTDRVWAWGNNPSGMGHPTLTSGIVTVGTVDGPLSFRAVDAGKVLSLGIAHDGQVHWWGRGPINYSLPFFQFAAQSPVTMERGTTAARELTIGSIDQFFGRNDYAGELTLTIDGLPAGVTGTFSPGRQAFGDNTATLILSASPAATPGTTTATLRTSGPGLFDQTRTFQLTILAPDFTLGAVQPVTVARGASAVTTVTVNRVSGYSGAINLVVENLATGVTSAGATIPAGANQAPLIISASASASTGTNNATVRATGEGVSERTVLVAVTVTSP